MTLEQMEHVLRAAAAITNETDFVETMLQEGIVRRETIMDLLSELPEGQRKIASRNFIAIGRGNA